MLPLLHTTIRAFLTRALIIGVCVGLVACGSPKQESKPQTQAPAPASSAAQAPTAQHFDLRGKVVSVAKAAKTVTVDHEAIPGFMGAMTMAYPVKDAHALDNVTPGEPVTAKVVSTGSEYWLEDIAPAH